MTGSRIAAQSRHVRANSWSRLSFCSWFFWSSPSCSSRCTPSRRRSLETKRKEPLRRMLVFVAPKAVSKQLWVRLRAFVPFLGATPFTPRPYFATIGSLVLGSPCSFWVPHPSPPTQPTPPPNPVVLTAQYSLYGTPAAVHYDFPRWISDCRNCATCQHINSTRFFPSQARCYQWDRNDDYLSDDRNESASILCHFMSNVKRHRYACQWYSSSVYRPISGRGKVAELEDNIVGFLFAWE